VETVLKNKNQMAVIQSCSNMPKNHPFCIGFEIVGENATISFNAKYGNETQEDFNIYFANGENKKLNIPGSNDYEEVLLHIKHCLKNNIKSELIDISNTIETQSIIERINSQLME